MLYKSTHSTCALASTRYFMHLPVLYKDEKTCLLQYIIVIEQHTLHLVHNYHWSTIQDGWVCPKCQKEALPFHHVSDSSIWSHNSSNSSIWSHNSSQSSTQDVNIDPTTVMILTINAKSLLPKVDELRGLCTYRHYMPIVVTETWLSPEVLDNKLAVDGYNLVQRDKSRHGGDVAIFLLNPYTSHTLSLN